MSVDKTAICSIRDRTNTARKQLWTDRKNQKRSEFYTWTQTRTISAILDENLKRIKTL